VSRSATPRENGASLLAHPYTTSRSGTLGMENSVSKSPNRSGPPR